jgi:hypothetical protein
MQDTKLTLRETTDLVLRFSQELGKIGCEITRNIMPAVTEFLTAYYNADWGSKLTAEERRIAYQNYAAFYTRTHPRGLSWRRLNRPQRHMAEYQYVMDHRSDAIAYEETELVYPRNYWFLIKS